MSKILVSPVAYNENIKLENVSKMINESGKLLTEVGILFKESETLTDINERIEKASNLFEEIADKEEEAYNHLKNII